jgi:hypothetical protein
MKVLRFLALLVLLAVPGCGRSEAPQDAKATATIRKARIFLIAVEDHGAAGPAVGCGDSAVPVDLELPAPKPALWGSLEALLAAGKGYDNRGLYNALANSPLHLQKIERAGPTARIYLPTHRDGHAVSGRRPGRALPRRQAAGGPVVREGLERAASGFCRSALRERHTTAAVVRLLQQAEALRAGHAEHRGAARGRGGFGRGNGADGPGSKGDEAREDQSSHGVPPG